jgi:hypothetical protein
MTPLETDHAAALHQLHAAQEGLDRLGALLPAGGGSVEALLVRGSATVTRSQVDEAVRLLAGGGATPEVARVPCSFCRQMIRPAATLCGFCWRRRAPAAG